MLQNVDWVKVGAGLVIVLAGLYAIDQTYPQYSRLYVVAVILGVALTNKQAVQSLSSFLLSLTKPTPEVQHSK